MQIKLDINEVIRRPEYKFIFKNRRLGNHIGFLTFGGSISYGLNSPNSDIDIRGFCLPTYADAMRYPRYITEEENKDKSLIFGPAGFEQVTETKTDTTIYTFLKFVKLLSDCNPNVIEMLGCKPEHYTLMSPEGQKLIDNKHLFLTKIAYNTFAGYARGQFQRLKNAIGNDSGKKLFSVISLADSLQRLNKHLEMQYPGYRSSQVKFRISDTEGNSLFMNGKEISAEDITIMFDESNSPVVTVDGKPVPDEDIELRISLDFVNMPLDMFNSVTNEIMSNVKEINKHLGHRNKKKDDYHLCKHAMHLIRLYLMAHDILINGEINTYREKDRDFLLSIKNGKYMTDGTLKQEFFDMVGKFSAQLEDDYMMCKLPERVDYKAVNKLVMEINESHYKKILF